MLDIVLVFFFKQKTAYEFRISDWSSDVCSSDLTSISPMISAPDRPGSLVCGGPSSHGSSASSCRASTRGSASSSAPPRTAPRKIAPARWSARSEEHTSELQSLMRLTYAVFCLKKQKNSTRTLCRIQPKPLRHRQYSTA